ncbi:MAG: glycosyltransferase family 4 protein [bacterium]
MKICIVFYGHKKFSGAAFQAQLLARSLISDGQEVLFVCVDRPDSPSVLCRYRLAYETLSPDPEEMAAFFTGNKGRYELVHFFGMMIPPRVISLLKRFGIPVILRPAGLGLDDPLTLAGTEKGRNYLEKISMADTFIGISQAMYRSLLASPVRPVKVVNAVDTDLFSPVNDLQTKRDLKEKLGFPSQSQLVVFVGRFQQAKGSDIIMESWPLIRRACPGAVLAVIGSLYTPCDYEGNCRPAGDLSKARRDFDKFSSLFEAQAGVKFLEIPDKVEQYLQAADLFFFPSRREGMPNALLEAMACGLACVTSGIKEITEDIITSSQAGRAIESEDPREYAQAIIRLLGNPEERRRMGKKARQRMMEHFSTGKNLECHLNLYRELIDSHE